MSPRCSSPSRPGSSPRSSLPAVAAALAALVIGFFSIRVSGVYFIMLTLAFSQMFYAVTFQAAWLGAEDGIVGVPRPAPARARPRPRRCAFTSTWSLLVALAALALWRVVRSPFGHVLRGIHDNEARMEAVGYAVDALQALAFVVAGTIAGVAGALYVQLVGSITPDAFFWTTSGEALLMVIIGGTGTLGGAVLGAAAFILLQSLVSSYTERWMLILGLTFILFVLFAPGRHRGRAARARGAPRVTPRRSSPSTGSRGASAPSPRSTACRSRCRRASAGRIIGPNGAGKTTLFNLITGTARRRARAASSSRGSPSPGLPPHAVARRGHLALVPAQQSLPAPAPCCENLRLAAAADGRGSWNLLGRVRRAPRGPLERAREAAEAVGLTERLGDPAGSLSYGEQRQLEVGVALATAPALLLLDEPTAGMSPEETQRMTRMLEALPREVTLLIIEHDMDVVASLADRVTVLHYGEVLTEGTFDEVKADPRVYEVYLGAA